MTWIIVEDEEDIRNIVTLMVNAWGHKPLAFPNGNAAWAWLDEVESGAFRGELPELALLDIRMPGHTGDEVAGRIRRTAKLTNIAIVLMTAFTLSQKDYERVMQTSGADALVYKPLPDMNELHALLHGVLAEKQR